jgi:hypothetical protein
MLKMARSARTTASESSLRWFCTPIIKLYLKFAFVLNPDSPKKTFAFAMVVSAGHPCQYMQATALCNIHAFFWSVTVTRCLLEGFHIICLFETLL